MERRSFIKGALIGGSALGVKPQEADAQHRDTNFERVEVGDEFLKVALINTPDGLKENYFLVNGAGFGQLVASPWVVNIDGKFLSPQGSVSLLRLGEHNQPTLQAVFEGRLKDISWRLSYETIGRGLVTKSLQISSGRKSTLQLVTMWHGRALKAPFIARTGGQGIAAFYRENKSGLFVSLDFPYSNIKFEGGETKISYPPFSPLAEGQPYTSHSLTIGAVRLEGRERSGLDIGEVAAMDEYIQERYRPRFERPMFVSASINNRYTQVENDHIFYTMKDHPTLNWNTDILKRELALMPQLGIEYYQVFPGVFDWVPSDPPPERVDELMNVARSHKVRMGDYSGTNELFCPHYNEYGNSLNNPDWQMRNEDGSYDKGFCFGKSEFVDYYKNTVVRASKRFGFEIHCLDFLRIRPCYAAEHGHPPGPDSIYHQVVGLVDLLEAINAVSPHMMTWSNSGNWQEFLPKIAWSNPNLYLTDPFINTAWPGLNMTRLLDDARREQMVTLHNSHFVPYRFFTNCQYFFSQNSIVPDIRNFEYGALSTLAVTPNLALAEVRPWLDKLNGADRERAIDFYQRWTDFLKNNFDLWKKTYQAGEDPGVGAIEVYSHADGNHGYLFLVNPQYWGRTIDVTLDESIGFRATQRYELAELYPVERLRLTASATAVDRGSKLSIHVPAQQVIVLEVKPFPANIDSPRVYGLPGTIEKTKTGYLLKTRGPQGAMERAVVLLPSGSLPIISAEVRSDVPPQPKRLWSPTLLSAQSNDDDDFLFDITFRKAAAPSELRQWSVKAGSLEEGIKTSWEKGLTGTQSLKFPLFVDTGDEAIRLPLTKEAATKLGLGPLANFCGAYIDNAFSELQETWVDLRTGNPGPQLKIKPSSGRTPELRPLLLPAIAKDQRKDWWLQTIFHLPFMYTIGAEPPFDEHTILVLPFIDSSPLKEIKAWINGVALKVQRYDYPRNRKLGTYYADLVGSGARGGINTMIIHLQS